MLVETTEQPRSQRDQTPPSPSDILLGFLWGGGGWGQRLGCLFGFLWGVLYRVPEQPLGRLSCKTREQHFWDPWDKQLENLLPLGFCCIFCVTSFILNQTRERIWDLENTLQLNLWLHSDQKFSCRADTFKNRAQNTLFCFLDFLKARRYIFFKCEMGLILQFWCQRMVRGTVRMQTQLFLQNGPTSQQPSLPCWQNNTQTKWTIQGISKGRRKNKALHRPDKRNHNNSTFYCCFWNQK